MALALAKSINSRIRSNKVLDYVCSTHFWGPVSNFTIPIAAIRDTGKSPEYISGPMTCALIGYSSIMMRFAFAIRPQNYLIFVMHVTNWSAQVTQLYRYTDHHYLSKGVKSQS